ncbi:hypothetical protein JYT22_00420 [Endomicrobium sp. AH-315-J14]|nr:hypothetical protein [Endomicrobium sp. AH-315-J14]
MRGWRAPWSLITLLSASVLSCGGCPDYPCQPPLELNVECAWTKNCEVDGTVVESCEDSGKTPACPLWALPARAKLTIPLGAFWQSLGERNDMWISNFRSPGKLGYPDLRDAVLLFDGSPADGCYRSGFEIRCDDVPTTVKTLEFSYGDPDSVTQQSSLHIYMRDLECESEHQICAEST